MKIEIEICLKDECEIEGEIMKKKILSFLKRNYSTLPLNYLMNSSEFKSDICLFENVESIRIGDLVRQSSCPDPEPGFINLNLNLDLTNFDFFFFTFSGAADDEQNGRTSSDNEPLLATRTCLPSQAFEGLWETLAFEEPIKQKLLTYMNTALLFGDSGVNSNIISINRVCLLHGPPGTGKTTLAKALAQKLTIRMGQDRYPAGGILVEINPNAIFSKFFAESSKLLLKMFNEMHTLLDDEDCFVCLLMDEVESLTAARKAAMNGNEPSDAIRVVNCLLTQIDKLKDRGNVLVIATSNITEAIDIAFLDRADIKQFIGDPSLSAVYTILRQAILELMRCTLLTPVLPFPGWPSISRHPAVQHEPHIRRLVDVATRGVGLSGRTLTKISFLAYSRWIQQSGGVGGSGGIRVDEFMEALETVIVETKKRGDEDDVRMALDVEE